MASTIVVTGASSDIGLALIRELSRRENTELVCQHRSGAEALEHIARDARARISTVRADFSQTEGILEWGRAVSAADSAPEGLFFLAAPPLRLARMKDCALSAYEDQFRVQVSSAAETLRVALPGMMKARRGSIVFLLSSAATASTAPGSMAPYLTAKYALRGLFHATTTESSARNVRVTAVAPGLVRTKFLIDVPQRLVELEAERAGGRLLEAEEVAAALVRCFDDSSSPSGQMHAL